MITVHDISGLFTIFSLIAFIGVCVWAFSKKRTKGFDEAARLPIDDDENR
jgi:cytochrome c oxidase cbb3-type subunit IV